MNARAVAVKILAKVFKKGNSLSDAIRLENNLINDKQALIKELCFGTCRWYWQLQSFTKQLLTKPLKEKDYDIHLLLLVGIYQLQYMRIPNHAVVSETVAAVIDFGKPWAKGLVNGVLRSFIRRKDDLLTVIEKDAVSYYAHPDWLVRKISSDWPEHWKDVLVSNNVYPPLSLRVNLSRQSRETYLSKLVYKANDVEKGDYSKSCIRLAQAVEVAKLKGFFDGEVSVQDEAAQLAVSILDLKAGQCVLDACAAPGGKTCHILESEGKLQVLIAIDNEPKRLEKIKENLDRLDQCATLICADAADVGTWWDGKAFDRILLDAPCSATGVIRRHPDIKILRKPEDVAKIAVQQLKLLRALWPTLKAGGYLVYATCSIFPEENVQQIANFLTEVEDAAEEPLPSNWGVLQTYGRQILPGHENMDGFYYCKLKKTK